MREAVTPPSVLDRVLRAAGPDLVLVGGQALAFWMNHYGVRTPKDNPFVSRDIDFLARSPADKESVHRLAQVIGGRVILPHPRALTALVGQAVMAVSEVEFINIDVVFKVYGADTDKIREAAVEIETGNTVLSVMHPMDVLKSRLDNLHGLAEKQTGLGPMQLKVAIVVARRFQLDVALQTQSSAAAKARSATLRFAKFIEGLALSDAGRKVARRHGICVADAVEPEAIPDAAFAEKKLPQLLALMSSARLKELGY